MGNTMKRLKKLLAACFLMAATLTVGTAYAADAALPDLGETRAKADIAADALKKDAVCTRCHDETETAPIWNLYQTKHGVRGDARTPTCQSCHGPSEKHLGGNLDGKGRPSPDFIFKKGVYQSSSDRDRAGQCLACHKGGARNNWDGGVHQNNGVACNDCHVVHRAKDKVFDKKTQPEVCFACHKDQRADSKKISHHPIEEGKVTCSDCHNPHGSTGPKLMKKNTVTETCFQCHAEKRGPFLWEHQPVTEDCTNCHTPHGSNVTPLLKSRAPFLCDECHDGPHNSQQAYGSMVGGVQGNNGLVATTAGPKSPNTSAVGRACMNCHVMVHGSNSPAGAFLHR